MVQIKVGHLQEGVSLVEVSSLGLETPRGGVREKERGRERKREKKRERERENVKSEDYHQAPTWQTHWANVSLNSHKPPINELYPHLKDKK